MPMLVKIALVIALSLLCSIYFVSEKKLVFQLLERCALIVVLIFMLTWTTIDAIRRGARVMRRRLSASQAPQSD
jgi:hypothetical protein